MAGIPTRDEFPKAVIEALGKRIAFVCSNPACGCQTIGPQSQSKAVINLGVAAHITAASVGGPRYDPRLSSEMRCAAENGIWLCQSCAKLIDSDATRFTVSLLGE